jgi:hypothetical protein
MVSPLPLVVFTRAVGLRWILPALGILLLASGCEEERNVAGKKAGQAPAEDHFIVGKRTREIKNAVPEVQTGKASIVAPQITAKDPITLPANAYVTIVGETSILHIQHALDLYYAENGRYPKNYDEFVVTIVKPNNIALPMLPYYQKYGYDEKEHTLVILEYPGLKNQGPPGQ